MGKATFLVSIFLLFIACENVTEYPDGQDLIEMESVWQYLKAFSIHQDECVSGSDTSSCEKKLRDSPFQYESPEEMMTLLYDTLGGVSYTRYSYITGTSSSARVSAVKSASNQVIFYALTSSTALLRIEKFATDTTYSQFCEVVPNLGSYENCIVDLCQNPGGDLEELDSILEMFLPENTPYILARERAYNSTTKQYETIDFRPLKTVRSASPYLTGKNMIVLMDYGSASASEIMASALKDGYGAQLVGLRSYGKAIGQIKLSRRGRNGLQITFLQLKGISAGAYQNVGLTPDIITANLSIYQSKSHLLEIVRLLEPEATSSDLQLSSTLKKTSELLLPEGYIVRDAEDLPLPE